MEVLTGWLLEQGPIVVVMGVVIVWMAKRLSKSEDEKTKLSENVIKLTTLWENKATDLADTDKEFKEKVKDELAQIKAILKSMTSK